MRDQIRVAADVALSLRPVIETTRKATRRRLRVLAYHGVDNPAAFDRQMEHVAEYYHPVSADEVASALKGDHSLPNYAVWVTFDDGLPSVMRNALPSLNARHISATMFVCPGVVNTSDPLWWQLVEICTREGIRPPGQPGTDADSVVRQFKRLDNETLLTEIAELGDAFRRLLGREPEQSQLTTVDLKHLLEQGHSIGNHTWTHPLLDRCSESAQRTQIISAHEWLEKQLGARTLLFAYPNGAFTSAAEHCLRDLGYSLAALFDHRLGSHRDGRLRVSRLRTGDGDSANRFAATLAGSHPLVSAVRS